MDISILVSNDMGSVWKGSAMGEKEKEGGKEICNKKIRK